MSALSSLRISRTALRLALVLVAAAITAPLARAVPMAVGTLQSDPRRAGQMLESGVTVAEVGLAWDRFEPAPGQCNDAYLSEIRGKMAAFRQAGMRLVLDFGMQYPPRWVLDAPNARFVNQFGTGYVDPSPGKNVANGVFNQQIREWQAAYVRRVFQELGTGFLAVRLGWGWYSELHFPPAQFKEEKNCYWGFDAVAQGKTGRLPPGIPVCPVRGFVPGGEKPGLEAGRLFIDWYFNALRDYQNWQVAIVRPLYEGKLLMLYPSWGIRPGQTEAALQAGLKGTTVAERGGDMAQGVDFARLVGSINDKDVLPHCTWLDSEWGLDGAGNPWQWSPIHYLRRLVDAHPLKLHLSGENTGNADRAALKRTFERARRENLDLVLWAFEPQLFEGRFVSLEVFSKVAGEQG